MAQEEMQTVLEREIRPNTNLLWTLGGCALSFTTLCSLVAVILLVISASVNAYLVWTMSGYELSVSRPETISTVVVVVTPTGELAMAQAETPAQEPTSTPTSTPTDSAVQTELSTLAAIATNVAANNSEIVPVCTPSAVEALPATGAAGLETPEAEAAPAATSTSRPPAQPLTTSSNSYKLIPIEGGRDARPADEHGDLNLKLREPQPADFEPSLIEISGSGIDPQSPKLSTVFEPEFTKTYAVHDWDWGCNCKGNLIQDGSAVLVEIKTTPGQPVFIPKTERDIYEGKYYAVVLYASEDSLTFVYARAGTVVNGYTIHYVGFQTDPNLVKLFRDSKGNELPGLTLDTPVGVATDEILVAMRDNGKFLDARSRLDWWK